MSNQGSKTITSSSASTSASSVDWMISDAPVPTTTSVPGSTSRA